MCVCVFVLRWRYLQSLLITDITLVLDENLSPGKKKVHFAQENKEHHDGGQIVASQDLMFKRLQIAYERSEALRELEKICQLKSKSILGLRWSVMKYKG